MTVGAAALAFGVVAAVGAVAPAGATPPPYGHVLVTVYEGEDATGEPLASAELWCDPDAGSHPDPAAACAALEEADGDPDRLAGEPGPCTLEYVPVTATAEGYWHGGATPVTFERTYPNRCALHRETAPVFDILEPSRG
jgi:hypothetical protein